MRLLLAAPLLALGTCVPLPASEPTGPVERPACPGMIVEQIGETPLTCDVSAEQTLIRVGGDYPCDLLGGTEYVSPWPGRPVLCIDIDY